MRILRDVAFFAANLAVAMLVALWILISRPHRLLHEMRQAEAPGLFIAILLSALLLLGGAGWLAWEVVLSRLEWRWVAGR